MHGRCGKWSTLALLLLLAFTYAEHVECAESTQWHLACCIAALHIEYNAQSRTDLSKAGVKQQPPVVVTHTCALRRMATDNPICQREGLLQFLIFAP